MNESQPARPPRETIDDRLFALLQEGPITIFDACSTLKRGEKTISDAANRLENQGVRKEKVLFIGSLK